MDPSLDFFGFQVNPVELFGVVTGFVGVWLTTRRNAWCWPVGLVNVVLFLVVFADARLYADAALQVVYVGLLSYGWWFWLRGGEDHHAAPVTRLSHARFAALAGLVLVATVGAGFALSRFTDADLPYWDSFTTAASLVAQWLQARKIFENWIVWIVADVVYVGMYLVKGLELTAVLYASFLVLAVIGWRAWRPAADAVTPV